MLALLPVWLFFAPPEQPSQSYEQSVAEFDAALAALGTEEVSVAEATAALERALAGLAQHPEQIPNDSETLDRLAQARLGLAWQRLVNDDEPAAIAAMDEAIRSARGRSLPAGKFGPKVLRLYEDRLQALKDSGTAIIAVECGAIPCQIVVDERRSANPTDPLYLGSYRVWVGPRDGDAVWEFYEVKLSIRNEQVDVVYKAGANAAKLEAPPEPELGFEPVGPPVGATDTKPKKARMLPRWASILGMTVGAGLAVGGGLLLLDGACLDGSDVEPDADAPPCDRVWQRNVPAGLGYGLLGVGAGVFVVSGVVLTVDEVRVGDRKGKQAMLTWTFQF